MISSREIGMRGTARLGVLVALVTLAGCGGGDTSTTDTKSPASASTAKPAGKPPAKQAGKPAAPGATDAAQDAAAVDPDVAAALKDVNLPTQAEADAAAAQQINDANADAEFEKLQKELGGTEPPK